MKKIILIIIAVVAIFLVGVYLSVSETEDKFRTCEILNIEDVETTDFKKFDSVTVAASTLYEASFLKKVMQGEQYREAWATPVTVPIAFLDTLKGGLKVIEQGGGMQTHSLELEDSLGIRYTLRSLSKDPKKLVPEIAENLGVENIIIDGISAQHPYAAIVVAKLADAAKVLHTNPKLMFIPKQNGLGEFNDKFGNRLFLFEYESEGEVNWTRLSNASEILDTKDLQKLKTENSTLKIDQKALIRTRLFDLLIGDWDRHAKQWGWVITKTNDNLIAIPIAADRDNAFFNQNGIIPTLIANEITLPEVQAFDSEISNLEGLIRPFDEYFLRTATLNDFKTEAQYLQELLTDTKINEAFNAWPKAIDNLNGKEIRDKIIARRNDILEYAKKFHSILKDRPLVKINLKGSEDVKLNNNLSKCFDCEIFLSTN